MMVVQVQPQGKPDCSPSQCESHEGRLIRLEDAILESSKATAELAGYMKATEARLVDMTEAMSSGFQTMATRLDAREAADHRTDLRLASLEGSKIRDEQKRAKLSDTLQKLAIWGLTTGAAGAAGWAAKTWIP